MPSPLTATVAALFGLGLAPACARDIHVTGRSGHAVRVAVEGSWNRSCTPRAIPSIAVTASPAHGSVATRPEAFTIRHALSGDAQCVGRPGNGQALYYTSQPGFRGTDTLAATVSFEDGRTTDLNASVTVR